WWWWWLLVMKEFCCSDLCGMCLVVGVFFYLGRACFGNGVFGGRCFYSASFQFNGPLWLKVWSRSFG
ncbi:hypothetical protein A2U01_0041277, partial [Trifolium medium]|nr:hypothetical protein [Trifolium medium]